MEVEVEVEVIALEVVKRKYPQPIGDDLVLLVAFTRNIEEHKISSAIHTMLVCTVRRVARYSQMRWNTIFVCLPMP